MWKKTNNIDSTQIIDFVDIILNLSKYNINEKDANLINEKFCEYFINSSNKFYSSRLDKKTFAGILLATINKDYDLGFDWSELESKCSSASEDIIKFQLRINEAIKKNHTKDMKAEIVCFSILPEFQSRGLGSNLVNLFENDLIANGISKYYVFTDDNSNHLWYAKKNYKLLKTIPIKINDLKKIKEKHKKYNVYLYSKTI